MEEWIKSENGNIFLRKVDIKTWDTKITKQYEVNSVPSMRVYNRKGKLAGKPTSSLQAVQHLVQRMQ